MEASLTVAAVGAAYWGAIYGAAVLATFAAGVVDGYRAVPADTIELAYQPLEFSQFDA